MDFLFYNADPEAEDWLELARDLDLMDEKNAELSLQGLAPLERAGPI